MHATLKNGKGSFFFGGICILDYVNSIGIQYLDSAPEEAQDSHEKAQKRIHKKTSSFFSQQASPQARHSQAHFRSPQAHFCCSVHRPPVYTCIDTAHKAGITIHDLFSWSMHAICTIEQLHALPARIRWCKVFTTSFWVDPRDLWHNQRRSDDQEVFFWVKRELGSLQDSILDAV